jgi:hypothetical protein
MICILIGDDLAVLGENGVKARRMCPKERLADLGRVICWTCNLATEGVAITSIQDDKKWQVGGDDEKRLMRPRIYVEFGFGDDRDRTVVWRDRIG